MPTKDGCPKKCAISGKKMPQSDANDTIFNGKRKDERVRFFESIRRCGGKNSRGAIGQKMAGKIWAELKNFGA